MYICLELSCLLSVQLSAKKLRGLELHMFHAFFTLKSGSGSGRAFWMIGPLPSSNRPWSGKSPGRDLHVTPPTAGDAASHSGVQDAKRSGRRFVHLIGSKLRGFPGHQFLRMASERISGFAVDQCGLNAIHTPSIHLSLHPFIHP